jgi:hypothetical protein
MRVHCILITARTFSRKKPAQKSDGVTDANHAFSILFGFTHDHFLASRRLD